jgi:hypothetical protein
LAEIEQEVQKEVEQLTRRCWRDREKSGGVDLESWEMGIRQSLLQLGGQVLEKLLNQAGAEKKEGPVRCARQHPLRRVGTRDKRVLTVVGEIQIQRAYYYCSQCQTGWIPRDVEWDIVDSRFSPGVRRLMGGVGGKEPFAEGEKDLAELAGLQVSGKQVERASKQLGEQMEQWDRPVEGAAGKGGAIPVFYLAYDGTGVPMVKRELEGRAGKQGEAKTREAKLGCLFTQTALTEQGRPQRDENSTSYVGAIENVENFGARLFREAQRRGIDRAQKVVVLGDGAVWIWNLAEEHFPQAVQIVDLFHAREHVVEVGKIIWPEKCPAREAWIDQRFLELDEGRVEVLIGQIWKLSSQYPHYQEKLEKATPYFASNRERMRYREFRAQGFFVGSGVVEAGCKTIIGSRLKQSGMHWTVRGANAIIALRCLYFSGLWEDYWAARKTAA